MPRASVIIPARNAARTLPATLRGLREQTLYGGFEVIVVDDGSEDGTSDIAQSSGIVALVVAATSRGGAGAARNRGAAAAHGEVLAFLDADCAPAPGWLAAGVAATDRLDLVQGRVLPDPAVPVGPFDRTLVVADAHGLFESANLFVRRELFESVGGFPEGLERGGERPELARSGRPGAPFGEDVMFGWRAVRAGARTGFCASALAYHAVFRRHAWEHIAERSRLAWFPALSRMVPELREHFFYRRLFLSRRSASFDLACGGLVLAVLTRRRPAAALAAPYARLLVREALGWGRRRAPAVAVAAAVADLVGMVSLARGSLAAHTLVL